MWFLIGSVIAEKYVTVYSAAGTCIPWNENLCRPKSCTDQCLQAINQDLGENHPGFWIGSDLKSL